MGYLHRRGSLRWGRCCEISVASLTNPVACISSVAFPRFDARLEVAVSPSGKASLSYRGSNMRRWDVFAAPLGESTGRFTNPFFPCRYCCLPLLFPAAIVSCHYRCLLVSSPVGNIVCCNILGGMGFGGSRGWIWATPLVAKGLVVLAF